ncbi:hypothetical protein Hte_009195 [Hypoxylon texense]
MGRLVPWAKYRMEWEEIRNERRKRGSLLDRRKASAADASSSSKLIPDPSSSSSSSSSSPSSTFLSSPSPPSSTVAVEQRYPWMPHLLSSALGLSRVRSYSTQARSPLFRLPAELRLAVWRYAVGGHGGHGHGHGHGGVVAVVRKTDKLAHAVLPRDRARLDAAPRVAARGGAWQPVGSERRVRADVVLAEASLLAMLQTCKRLYIEALPVLYGRNAFEFRTMEGFYRFLLLAPAAGLRAVRSLRIAWSGFGYWQHYERRDPESEMELELELDESWREICGAVAATMKGLRELTLHSWQPFDTRRERIPPADMARKILTPLGGLPEQVKLAFTVQQGDDVVSYSL